jgi:hypothetical protein
MFKDNVYYHRDEAECNSHCEDRCTMIHNKRKRISNKVNSIANQFDDLLAITKPNTRNNFTEDDVAKIFDYLRSELKETEKAILKGKKPFTLRTQIQVEAE